MKDHEEEMKFSVLKRVIENARSAGSVTVPGSNNNTTTDDYSMGRFQN